ncbi:MAG TPA: UTP--glucose-1-phosphate uridylyltransferase [Chloroflexi bacterium]|jgi:UTP--glucose-1-phosphate uridylyltransferase|nr:UTP--glucose-1-phosphate uridylyltransferase [Chloroflexota bacterium]
MRVTKAVITAAGRDQRALPLQTLIDRDGTEKSVLCVIVEEALRAGIEEICVIVCPGDETAYAAAAGEHSGRLTFLPQEEPLGHGHAVYCARAFVDGEPFLHLVGDHLYVSAERDGCARQIVALAEAEACSVSAVQPSRESLLPYYGTIGGRRVPGRQDLYIIEDVIEKPTPTEAEQRLIVPGLRAGHYLCFFGMHVLTPTVMDILAQRVADVATAQPSPRTPSGGQGGLAVAPSAPGITLAEALAELATRERYLAVESTGMRYDVGVKYGLLIAQLALALSGRDRDEVLSRLVEMLALRQLGAPER